MNTFARTWPVSNLPAPHESQERPISSTNISKYRTNHPESLRLLGRFQVTDEWQEILPKTHLSGHALYRQVLAFPTPAYQQIRVEIYPDGGVSRLGLYI